MWRRRSWFSLNGKAGIPGQTEGRSATSIALRAPPAGSVQQRDRRLTHTLRSDRALGHGNVTSRLGNVVTPLNGRTPGDRLVPALHIRVLFEIDCLPFEARDPGPDRDVGDRVVVRHEFALGQAAVEDAVETMRLLGEALFGIGRLTLVEAQEVMSLPQHRADAAHLPHQPLEDAIARLALARERPRAGEAAPSCRPGRSGWPRTP